MKSVLLINPYFNLFEQAMINRIIPPLELAYILTMLKEKKISADIIDANALKLKSDDSFWDNIQAEIFVFTSASLGYWQCPPIDISPLITLIKKVKVNNPNAKLILIGPHGTAQPERIQEQLSDVFIIKGEPEHVTVEAIETILNKQNKFLDKILGVYNKNNKIDTPKKHTKFNSLPLPAYDMLPLKQYQYPILGKNFAIVEASRGCHYKCSFCSQIMFPPNHIKKNPKKVLDELEYLESLNIKNIEFSDLEFCFNKQHVKHICQGILQRKISLNWCISTRVDSVDQELLALLKKAGCSLIHYGVETGNAQILAKIKKGITLKKVKEVFALTEKTGIKTLAHFILGNKGEIPQDINNTINFAKDLNPHYVSFGLNIAYPGASGFSQLHKEGYNAYDTEIDLTQLKELQFKANLSFYLRLHYIYKSLSSISSWHDFQILLEGFKNYFIPFLIYNRN